MFLLTCCRGESTATSRLFVRCLEAILYTLDNTLDPKPNASTKVLNKPAPATPSTSEMLSEGATQIRIAPPGVMAWNTGNENDLTLSDACIDIIESYVPARAVYTENKVLFTRPPPLELRQRSRDILGGGSPKGVLSRSRETSPAHRSRNTSPESNSPKQFRATAESPRDRGVFTINENVSYQDVIEMSSPPPVASFGATDSALPSQMKGRDGFGLTSIRLQPRRNVNSR